MVKIYTSPSCSSCRKVKQWFTSQHIPFEERNIFDATLDEKELREILAKSENGTEDIISSRSKIIKENNIDIDSMSIKDLVSFIKENPSVLKRPIMVDNRRIQVGYNSEEIMTFIPQARRIAMENCSPDKCPNYYNCDHIKQTGGCDI